MGRRDSSATLGMTWVFRGNSKGNDGGATTARQPPQGNHKGCPYRMAGPPFAAQPGYHNGALPLQGGGAAAQVSSALSLPVVAPTGWWGRPLTGVGGGDYDTGEN